MFCRGITGAVLSALISFQAASQVFADHNLPRLLPTGEQVEVTVVIHKPVTREFVQYELIFQPGIAVRELHSAGGTFKSDDSRVKIMWSIAPQTPEITLKLGVLAGSAGTYTLGQRVEYSVNGERRTALLENVAVRAESGTIVAQDRPMQRLKQMVPAQLPPTRIDSIEQNLRDPGKAAVHVAQLRKDAREARKVGESELKQADLELAAAKKELEKSGSIANADERRKRVAQAELRVQKAETNKQIAQKILVLARTLEENADQIEQARRADSAAGRTEKEVDDLRAMFAGDNAGNHTGAPGDTLYHIQVGAFAHHPGKSPFSALGTVKIVSEDGLYKVLLGKFSTRQQAADLHRRLAAQGLDGFIVRYRGDQRLK